MTESAIVAPLIETQARGITNSLLLVCPQELRGAGAGVLKGQGPDDQAGLRQPGDRGRLPRRGRQSKSLCDIQLLSRSKL